MEDKRSDGPEADGERRPPSTELSAAVVQRYGRRGGNARRSDGEPWRLWQRVVDWVAPLESSPDVTAAAASDSPIGAPARLEIVLPDGSRVRLIGVRQPSGDDRHVVIALSQDRDYPTELLAGLKALTDLPPSRPPSTDVRQAPMSGQIDSSASADASAVDLPSAAAPAGQAVARTTGAEAVADAAPDQLPSLDPPPASVPVLGLWVDWPGQGIALGPNPLDPARRREPVLLTYLDRGELASWAGLSLAAGVLRVGPESPYGFVRELAPLPNTLPPDQHYGYALQWFGFAVALVVIVVVLSWKHRAGSTTPNE